LDRHLLQVNLLFRVQHNPRFRLALKEWVFLKRIGGRRHSCRMVVNNRFVSDTIESRPRENTADLPIIQFNNPSAMKDTVSENAKRHSDADARVVRIVSIPAHCLSERF
jgi:hypothetical protein